MGLLSSPISRLLGLVAIVALYVSFTGSYLGSAALSGTAARALYLLALCLFIGARTCFWISALAALPLLSCMACNITRPAGVGNWTTFVFGIVAFKNLPRLVRQGPPPPPACIAHQLNFGASAGSQMVFTQTPESADKPDRVPRRHLATCRPSSSLSTSRY